MTLPRDIAGALATDTLLWPDFLALCDCGGRLAGTPSEAAALAFLREAGTRATGRAATVVPTRYAGWTAQAASLTLLDGKRRIPLACLPLIRSASGSVTAEVVDLGRGTAEEFAQAGTALAGRIALVRHEYMFAAGHLHRRAKYAAALRAGASGFLIAGPLPTGVVAGSSGRGDEPGIPALGISPEAAARLSPPVGHARAALARPRHRARGHDRNPAVRPARHRSGSGRAERPPGRPRAGRKRAGQRDRRRRGSGGRARAGAARRDMPARAAAGVFQRRGMGAHRLARLARRPVGGAARGRWR